MSDHTVEYVYILCAYDKENDVIIDIIDAFGSEELTLEAMAEEAESLEEGLTFLIHASPIVQQPTNKGELH